MFNHHKAGLANVDKQEVNRIIENISRGTPFWENQQRRNARHDERIQQVLARLKAATDQELSQAQAQADEFLNELTLNLEKVALHIDMDAFFASVEERDDPTLKTKPMAVGGHSMLSTSNYSARQFGVRAGLPGFIALKLCPQLVLVPLNYKKYEAASAEVMEVLSKYDPNLVIYGLDEAALDITHLCQGEKTPEQVAEEIRKEVAIATNLTCSGGVAPNKMLAKVCADINKPNGQFHLSSQQAVDEFVQNLSVRKVPGIGQVQEKILTAIGCNNCSDFIKNRAALFLAFSESTAKCYLATAKGIGSKFCEDVDLRGKRKSKSAETTFKDTSNMEILSQICAQLSDRLSEELVESNLTGKLITVKFKMESFDVLSRSVALEVPTNSRSTITSHALRILTSVMSKQPSGTKLRLLGVRMSNFHEGDPKQTTLSQMLRPKDETKQEPESPLKTKGEINASTDEREKCSLTVDLTDSPSTSSHDPSDFPMGDSVVNEDHSPQNTSDSDKVNKSVELVEETFCPVCGVILRRISELQVNRHIQLCLDEEHKRASPQSRTKSEPSSFKKKIKSKAGGSGPSRRQVKNITSFFSK